MKRVGVFLMVMLVALNLGCSTKPIVQEVNKTAVVIDKDYVMALGTADMFLDSWLMRDQAKGRIYLSDGLIQSMKDEDIGAFFTGLSNPHHQAYEIIGGERVDDNTIRFNIWLYEYYTGENPPAMEKPKPYYIDVAKCGKNQFNEDVWKVIQLPTETK